MIGYRENFTGQPWHVSVFGDMVLHGLNKHVTSGIMHMILKLNDLEFYVLYRAMKCLCVCQCVCVCMRVWAFRTADHQARSIQLNLTTFITGIMGNLAAKDGFGPSGNYNSSKKKKNTHANICLYHSTMTNSANNNW